MVSGSLSGRWRALAMWPVAVVGVGGLLWAVYRVGRDAGPPQVVSAGLRIEDVRKIAKLGVLRVQVADVIEGSTRGAKAIVLVRGDADMAVDLEQIALCERNDQQRTVVLELPQPQPERPRVDHAQTRIYELRKTGLAALNPLADPRQTLLEDCMRAAQATVEKAVRGPDFAAQARQHMEALLGAYGRPLGWTVAVRWK